MAIACRITSSRLAGRRCALPRVPSETAPRLSLWRACCASLPTTLESFEELIMLDHNNPDTWLEVPYQEPAASTATLAG
ncbi:hypothetical protein D3C87_912730 [compost metagenome]